MSAIARTLTASSTLLGLRGIAAAYQFYFLPEFISSIVPNLFARDSFLSRFSLVWMNLKVSLHLALAFL